MTFAHMLPYSINMNVPKKSALFIGRFQPFHKGHLEMTKKILRENDHVTIIIGGAEDDYKPSDPLNASERYQLINESLKEAKISPKKYDIIPVHDIHNDLAWVSHVNNYVPPYTKVYTGSKLVKKCYKSYPEIKVIEIKKRIHGISATKIRTAMLKNKNWEKMVMPCVAKKLKKWDIPARLCK